MIKFFDLHTYVTPAKEALTAKDVRQILNERFRQEGKDDLVAGAVKAKGDDFLVAEIRRRDGSLVKLVEVNKRTGAWRP